MSSRPVSGVASAVPEDGTLAAASRAGDHRSQAGRMAPDLGKHVIGQRPPPFERYEVLTAEPRARTSGLGDHQTLVGGPG
jgi:hypothetical protein